MLITKTKLFKRAGKSLTSDEYGKNIISYLDNSHSQTSITITDLQKVLTALNKNSCLKSKKNMN